MKRYPLYIALFHALAFAAPPTMAYADVLTGWHAGVAIEDYRWEEIISSLPSNPQELGNRLVLQLGWKPENLSRAPYITYTGKIYGGTVDYNTFIMAGIPAQTSSDYLGMLNEAKVVFPVNIMDIVAGLGYDRWSRAIADGLTANNTRASGYTEIFEILFLRLGVSLNFFESLELAGGIKQTVLNNETVLQGTVHPGQSTSPYFSANYMIDSALSVEAYYDSWRFAQSNTNAMGVLQPKSNMDAVGIVFIWAYK